MKAASCYGELRAGKKQTTTEVTYLIRLPCFVPILKGRFIIQIDTGKMHQGKLWMLLYGTLTWDDLCTLKSVVFHPEIRCLSQIRYFHKCVLILS